MRNKKIIISNYCINNPYSPHRGRAQRSHTLNPSCLSFLHKPVKNKNSTQTWFTYLCQHLFLNYNQPSISVASSSSVIYDSNNAPQVQFNLQYKITGRETKTKWLGWNNGHESSSTHTTAWGSLTKPPSNQRAKTITVFVVVCSTTSYEIRLVRQHCLWHQSDDLQPRWDH